MPSSHKTSDVSSFKFFRIVAVRSFTAVSVVLMPIGMKASGIEAPLLLVCFLLLSASLFLVQMIPHCIGSSLGPHSHQHIHVSCALCVSLIASTSPFTSSSSSSSLYSFCSSFCPSTFSRMWWTNPLCNSAEDLGTLAENEPPTGNESNKHNITEACVEYTQESTGEQRSPNDFDNDDVTMARRSRTHAEDEPITLKKVACRPVCRRQSVMIERGDALFAHLC